jgi:hypothetical protein
MNTKSMPVKQPKSSLHLQTLDRQQLEQVVGGKPRHVGNNTGAGVTDPYVP